MRVSCCPGHPILIDFLQALFSLHIRFPFFSFNLVQSTSPSNSTMSADLVQKLQPHAKEIAIALGVILLALVLLAGKKQEKPVLDPVEFRPFKLVKKTQLSKNTYR